MLNAFLSVQDVLTRLRRDDRGATAVEYGLIVALIAAVIVVVVGTLGQQILAAFNSITGNIPVPGT